MKAAISAGVAGLLFAVGLGLGGMTNPQKVVGFLNVAGDWDPSLMFVMGGALLVHIPLRFLLTKRERPIFAPSFPQQSPRAISGRLLAGSAIFGIGWGLGGYCPGPGIVSAGIGSGSAVVFTVSMLAGMAVFQMWSKLGASASSKAQRHESPTTV